MARGGQTPRPRHIPQRTCVACRQARDKRDLARIVRTPGGTVVVDPSGKLSGRGAYLCRESACWNAALGPKRAILAGALKIDALPQEDLPALAAYGESLTNRPRPARASSASS